VRYPCNPCTHAPLHHRPPSRAQRPQGGICPRIRHPPLILIHSSAFARLLRSNVVFTLAPDILPFWGHNPVQDDRSDVTQCRMTGVTLHGVISPDPCTQFPLQVFARLLRSTVVLALAPDTIH